MRRLFAALLLLCFISPVALADDGYDMARSLANFMEDHYGITILIGDKFAAITTSGFELGEQPAGRTPLQSMLATPNYADEIKLIDDCFSSYPVGFFGIFVCGEAKNGLRFLLPDQIVAGGTTMAGVTTVQDGYYNIFLGAGAFNSRNVHDEIWHAMEFRITYDYPDAFQDWASLNPAGFVYGEDVASNDAYFVRDYSVVNEEEDRTTVIEAVFAHDANWWAEHPFIQKKLDVLLKDTEPVFGKVYFPE